jgi:hypothetical protein
MTNLIERAEGVATTLSDHNLPYGQQSDAAQTIRDLIAALKAAPTAEQLRAWAVHQADWDCAIAMRAAADRMEGK